MINLYLEFVNKILAQLTLLDFSIGDMYGSKFKCPILVGIISSVTNQKQKE